MAGGYRTLHSALVMEREALKVWTILLAILTFSLHSSARSSCACSAHRCIPSPLIPRAACLSAILVLFIGWQLDTRLRLTQVGGYSRRFRAKAPVPTISFSPRPQRYSSVRFIRRARSADRGKISVGAPFLT